MRSTSELRSRLEQANDNAADFWSAQARARGWDHLRRPGFTAVRCARDGADLPRVVITRPYPDPQKLTAEIRTLLREWDTGRCCLEDPYQGLELAASGLEPSLPMPVMTREPDAVADRPSPRHTGAARPGAVVGAPAVLLTVGEETDADGLAEVERTVVDGFPVAGGQPGSRGRLLPPELLEQPGFRFWLARVGGVDGLYEVDGADGADQRSASFGRGVNGQPAAACVTYDNGETVGVYWVATLPAHRSNGLARAVLSQALEAHPGRLATLTATLLGEPLYRRLGFTEQGLARWWRSR
ncbi:GNAT family N-acetyltransferase [Saccharothrix sp. ST-888]|uniref:GNAT family N-acetyltransferase n=1 Tax=Saccharothrix sp. ST-888 TaxID=1427391 RepID=UPI000696F421|nr:GNAT family N-acetyltransferase [Saccharothrix sp. ST-888]